MSEPPALTVALPTCNGGRHLREALVSIVAQPGVSFDLLISDDRSEDDTLDIVRDLVGDRARVSVNTERLGLAGNWNRCVELSQTPWVAIFHQDDVMHPGHLASHLRVIDSPSPDGIGLIASPTAMIDEAGLPISKTVIEPGGLVVPEELPRNPAVPEVVFGPGAWVSQLAEANVLRCSAVTINKLANQAVGGFDPSYRYAVDWDFWLRLANDWGLAWIEGPPTVSMRWHLGSETHRFKNGTSDLDEQIRLLDRLHDSGLTTPSARRRADARLARAFLNRSHVALKAGNSALARECLRRSIGLSRSVWRTIAADPRLLAQMATLAIAPHLAARWFAR